jgi:hypothetical protein
MRELDATLQSPLSQAENGVKVVESFMTQGIYTGRWAAHLPEAKSKDKTRLG